METRDSDLLQARQFGIQIPGGARCYPLLQNCSQQLWGPRAGSYTMRTGVLCRGKATGAQSWPHLHLVPRLRISGVIHLLPWYAFMACTGTTLLCLGFSEFGRHKLSRNKGEGCSCLYIQQQEECQIKKCMWWTKLFKDNTAYYIDITT